MHTLVVAESLTDAIFGGEFLSLFFVRGRNRFHEHVGMELRRFEEAYLAAAVSQSSCPPSAGCGQNLRDWVRAQDTKAEGTVVFLDGLWRHDHPSPEATDGHEGGHRVR